MPYIIYADIESLIRKIDRYENNPENSSTIKTYEHIPSRYSMSTILGFDQTEDKHTLYHGKDCMKIFCTSLREHAKNISDFKKKKRLPLTKEELKLHQDSKVCYICGKRILEKLSKSIYYRKGRDHCHYTGKYRTAAHSICNSKLSVPNEIPVFLITVRIIIIILSLKN